jgi:hypothetical protein
MQGGDDDGELEYESNVEMTPFKGDDANDPIIINSQSTDSCPNAYTATLAANELRSEACKPILGLIRVPNPAPVPSRPPGGFITIGKQGKPTFAQQAKKAQAQQATVPKATPITGIYSDNDLKNRALSATTIISNAKTNLDADIDPLLSKPNVIKRYKAVRNAKITLTPATMAAPSGDTTCNPRKAKKIISSTWMVRRKTGQAILAFQKPFNGDPLALIRDI